MTHAARTSEYSTSEAFKKKKRCLETEAAGQISSETSSLVVLTRCLTFQIKSLIGVSVLLIVLWLLIEFCLAAVLPDRFCL